MTVFQDQDRAKTPPPAPSLKAETSEPEREIKSGLEEETPPCAEEVKDIDAEVTLPNDKCFEKMYEIS